MIHAKLYVGRVRRQVIEIWVEHRECRRRIGRQEFRYSGPIWFGGWDDMPKEHRENPDVDGESDEGAMVSPITSRRK
jgi:hypothetical protein